MFIPIRTDYRMTRRPWVNYSLLAINIIVFLLGFHASSEEGYQRVFQGMLHPDAPALMQFFTCMFLHGNIVHLIGNMVFLWVFGNAVNDKLGQAGYLAFYLAGGVLAGVGYLLFSGQGPVLGASGAISAVTGAYLVLLPRSRVTVLMVFYWVYTFEMSSLFFLMFQLIWNMAATAGGMATPGGGGGGVAYAAHSAGYLFGIVVAAGLLAVRLLPRDAFDLLNLVHSRRRRARYRRIAGQGYDPFSYVSPKLTKPDSRWIETRTIEQDTPDSPAARELLLRKEIGQAVSQNDVAEAAKKYLQLVQVADEPVLPRPQQLDVANYLMATEQHAAAADAYERFVKCYFDYEYMADICLMLGLLYGRYLHQYDRAEHNLQRAIESLGDPRKLELARQVLANVRQGRTG